MIDTGVRQLCAENKHCDDYLQYIANDCKVADSYV